MVSVVFYSQKIVKQTNRSDFQQIKDIKTQLRKPLEVALHARSEVFISQAPPFFMWPARASKVHDCRNPNPSIHTRDFNAITERRGNRFVPSYTKCVSEHSGSDSFARTARLHDNQSSFACI